MSSSKPNHFLRIFDDKTIGGIPLSVMHCSCGWETEPLPRDEALAVGKEHFYEQQLAQPLSYQPGDVPESAFWIYRGATEYNVWARCCNWRLTVIPPTDAAADQAIAHHLLSVHGFDEPIGETLPSVAVTNRRRPDLN